MDPRSDLHGAAVLQVATGGREEMSPPGEGRREKFIRLANRRVNRALDDLRLIGNLANRTHYEFTEDDVRKIIKYLEDEVKNVKQKFEQAPQTRGPKFRI